MSNKEATVYVINVGKSMGVRHNGREVSDLEYAMSYVWDSLARLISTGRKLDNAAIVGVGTDEADNHLYNDAEEREEGYNHISVFVDLQQILMSHVRLLKEVVKPNNTDDGDVMSAIILAIALLDRKCKQNKWIRRIVVVTDGRNPMDTADIEHIVKEIQNQGIQIVILGIDFDDENEQFSYKEPNKNRLKAQNEATLRSFTQDCEGDFGCLNQAVEELSIPRPKAPPRSMNTFKGGHLSLGDTENYDTALSINVQRFYRTYQARAPTASAFTVAVKDEDENPTASGASKEAKPDQGAHQSLAPVKHSMTWSVPDQEASEGKRDVEKDVCVTAYEYGRTAVPISQADENITKLETTIGLQLLGFLSADKFERYLSMSNCNVIVGSNLDNGHALALSSLIHALARSETYALGRLVAGNGKPPVVVTLAPIIEDEGFEGLAEVQIPFAEDVRTYKFPPLEKAISAPTKGVDGDSDKSNKLVSNDALIESMDEYVDNMTLEGMDESGNRVELLSLDEFFSPVIHRINQAIKQRAINPEEPIPELPPAFQKLSEQPEALRERCQDILERLDELASLKKVPPRSTLRKRAREDEKPLSGLDVGDLLKGAKRVKISRNNAIPEFKQRLQEPENLEVVKDAAEQMFSIIEDMIRHSLGNKNYEQVIACLDALKKELIAFEEPALYNAFLVNLKHKILHEELGGDRREMWWLMRKNKVGLIEKKASEHSEVDEEEARKFLSMKE